MFLYLEQIVLSWVTLMPLPIFAPVASLIEEAIPPIPSPAITIVVGSVAQIQGYTIMGIIVLIFLAAIGKTIGASFVYFVSDKVENFIMNGRVAKFVGVTHEEIENFGERLGKGWRDYFLLIFLRALPIVPSIIVSIGSGLLKINFKLFAVTTFVGSLIRGAIYVYIGYVGAEIFSSFVKKTASIESLVQVVVVLIFVLALGYLYYKRGKTKV